MAYFCPPSLHAELPEQLQSAEAHSRLGMVATGSPEATDAAVRVLERGGNAIDAAVTASLALGVADSDASGLGGSTYMIIRLANGRTVSIDGTAPTPGQFDLAVVAAETAAGLADEAGDANLAGQLRRRLKHYRDRDSNREVVQ